MKNLETSAHKGELKNKVGRPKKKVDLDMLLRLKNAGMSYRRLSRVLGVSVKTVEANLKIIKL